MSWNYFDCLVVGLEFSLFLPVSSFFSPIWFQSRMKSVRRSPFARRFNAKSESKGGFCRHKLGNQCLGFTFEEEVAIW